MRQQMRRHKVLVSVLVSCALVVAIVAVVYPRLHGASASGPEIGSTVASVCPGKPQALAGDPAVEIGLPAITPHLNCTPSFTAQDVLAYLAAPRNFGRIQATEKPTVTRILFTTSQGASQLMQGESVEDDDAAVVCYVALRGTFIGESGPFGVSAMPVHSAVIVFDGYSGNIIVSGV